MRVLAMVAALSLLPQLDSDRSIPPDALHQDIPPVFWGTWSISPNLCGRGDRALFTRIEARKIIDYEKNNYLRLARLNEATDPPSFNGLFDVDSLGVFSTQRVRLDMEKGNLFISEDIGPDDEPTRAPFYRCSKDPNYMISSSEMPNSPAK